MQGKQLVLESSFEGLEWTEDAHLREPADSLTNSRNPRHLGTIEGGRVS